MEMSYSPVSDRELAAVVTFLEMHERPSEPVPPSPLSMNRIEQPDPEHYRDLFRLVGAPWLWFSRLIMPDDALAKIIRDPNLDLFAVTDEAGAEVGMVELDFREEAQCELAFLGLVPKLAGQGHGRWLLAESVSSAWRDGVSRVHVHTCTLDHPVALAAYRRAGFTPYKRAVERFADPRLLGILPIDCAPQVPLLGTLAPEAAPDSWT
jgi:GNAT superfamily N-acetyltransferase